MNLIFKRYRDMTALFGNAPPGKMTSILHCNAEMWQEIDGFILNHISSPENQYKCKWKIKPIVRITYPYKVSTMQNTLQYVSKD